MSIPSPPSISPPPPQHRGPDQTLIIIISLLTLVILSTFVLLCPRLFRRTNNSRHQNTDDVDDRANRGGTRLALDTETGSPSSTVTCNVDVAGDCVVCLGEFTAGEECRVITRCHHMFHSMCLDAWLNDHSNCPLCRVNVKGKN